MLIISLTACEKSPENTTKTNSQSGTSDSALNISINSNALNLGRKSALTRQLAQKWQLSDIDGRLVDLNEVVILDLTNIDSDTATLSLGKDCQAIKINLDTTNLAKGELQVRAIKRELNKCSTALEDNLMAMVGDIRSFNQQNLVNNLLTLNSFQNKLNFRPYGS